MQSNRFEWTQLSADEYATQGNQAHIASKIIQPRHTETHHNIQLMVDKMKCQCSPPDSMKMLS